MAMQKYRVRGVCFVPTECEMIVEAGSESEAISKALGSRWQQHILQNSSDEASAFDWEPTADAVSPNA
jgi:hypothetical protein